MRGLNWPRSGVPDIQRRMVSEYVHSAAADRTPVAVEGSATIAKRARTQAGELPAMHVVDTISSDTARAIRDTVPIRLRKRATRPAC